MTQTVEAELAKLFELKVLYELLGSLFFCWFYQRKERPKDHSIYKFTSSEIIKTNNFTQSIFLCDDVQQKSRSQRTMDGLFIR